MSILPIKRMWERVDLARNDSDTTLFIHLLYASEMILKLAVAGLVSAIRDDKDRQRS